jgi:tetratricopeptide (TPR) repeat protein
MARFWLVSACGVGLAAFAGCNSITKTPNQKMADQLAAAQQPPGLWERMTGQRSTANSPIPPTEVTAKPLSKPGTPVKIETEVEFAETALAAATDPATTGTERDRRLDQSRLQFTRILDRDPQNARAIMGLARVYTETGDKERAAGYLKQYFDVNPKDHKAAFDFAMIYGKKKDFPAAAAGCEFALSLDPENREYRKSFGFFLALCGEADRAVQVLTHNRTMTEAEARYSVAGILETIDRKDQAKQHLRIAVAADPLFEPAKALLADMDGQTVMPAQYQQR